MTRVNRCIVLFLAISWIFLANAQPAEPDPLFDSDTPLNITFEAPFAQIDRERDKDKIGAYS